MQILKQRPAQEESRHNGVAAVKTILVGLGIYGSTADQDLGSRCDLTDARIGTPVPLTM